MYQAAGATKIVEAPDFSGYVFKRDDDSAYSGLTERHRPFFEYTKAKQHAI